MFVTIITCHISLNMICHQFLSRPKSACKFASSLTPIATRAHGCSDCCSYLTNCTNEACPSIQCSGSFRFLLVSRPTRRSPSVTSSLFQISTGSQGHMQLASCALSSSSGCWAINLNQLESTDTAVRHCMQLAQALSNLSNLHNYPSPGQ